MRVEVNVSRIGHLRCRSVVLAQGLRIPNVEGERRYVRRVYCRRCWALEPLAGLLVEGSDVVDLDPYLYAAAIAHGFALLACGCGHRWQEWDVNAAYLEAAAIEAEASWVRGGRVDEAVAAFTAQHPSTRQVRPQFCCGPRFPPRYQQIGPVMAHAATTLTRGGTHAWFDAVERAYDVLSRWYVPTPYSGYPDGAHVLQATALLIYVLVGSGTAERARDISDEQLAEVIGVHTVVPPEAYPATSLWGKDRVAVAPAVRRIEAGLREMGHDLDIEDVPSARAVGYHGAQHPYVHDRIAALWVALVHPAPPDEYVGEYDFDSSAEPGPFLADSLGRLRRLLAGEHPTV